MIEAGYSFARALAAARKALEDKPTPQLDARVLLEHVSGLSRAEMIAADDHPLGPLVAAAYNEALERRRADEPVAYITGRQEFFGLSFSVGPGVLIPRPETEMLVEAALAEKPERVLDLGTGSGCILFALLRNEAKARGVGIEASAEAIAYAERNRTALRLDDRAELRRLTFAEAPVILQGRLFEVIVANPPYIPAGTELPPNVKAHEPREALFSGADGLDAHREVAAAVARLLSPHGAAFVEIGHDQGEAAASVYRETLPGFDVRTHNDAAGLARMVAVRPHASL